MRFSNLLERLFPGTFPGTACPTKPTAAGLRRGGPPGEESVGQRFTLLEVSGFRPAKRGRNQEGPSWSEGRSSPGAEAAWEAHRARP